MDIGKRRIEMKSCGICLADGTIQYAQIPESDGVFTLSAKDIPCGAEYVDMLPDFCTAKEGDEGYFVFNNSITRFVGHREQMIDMGCGTMRFVGCKTKDVCCIVIAEGLWAQHHIVIEKKEDTYRIFLRFMLEGCPAEEDIRVRVVFLSDEDADYSGMARAYRKYIMTFERLSPLALRANEHLRYAMEAPEIRIRMGWKPAPSPVDHQTRGNEPPMHVGCTFEQAEHLMEACKAQGVEKAEFCLVGWNVRGHDGRWPECFPVEEALGGENGLKRLLAKAREMGYKVVCHTNGTDCYTVADTFTDDLPMRTREGEWASHASWSGGKMYDLCPVTGNKTSVETIKKCAALGFSGVHYIDVISTVAPRRCFDKKHGCSQREYVEFMRELARVSKKEIGGFQSEGGYDWIAGQTDMSLYIDFHMNDKVNDFCDDNVPIWQIVYHDIILSNPGTLTVNYPAKEFISRLKFLEYGGHPVIYVNSKFKSDSDFWMGVEDFLCGNEDDILRTAKGIKKLCDDYAMVKDIRHEAMVQHERLSDTLVKVTYANQYAMLINYADKPENVMGVTIPAKDTVVLKN